MVLTGFVLAGVPAFLKLQRHTQLGILAFGGARYWIGQAREVEDGEAREHLRYVLDSGDYGVNAAENAVAGLSSGFERLRLFELLAELAPNDNWQRTYLRRAEQERHALPRSVDQED